MIFPIEDRWGSLSVLEHEYGAREVMLALWKSGELTFGKTSPDAQEDFICSTAAPYASNSFRQSKEFFRQAETSSWLVKPLLLYYGMLTGTKACLTFRVGDFFLDKLGHGLSRGNRLTDEALTADSVRVLGDGIYPLARTALRQEPLPAQVLIPIDEILQRLPEITGAYMLYTKGAAQSFILTKNPWIAQYKQDAPWQIVFDLPENMVKQHQKTLAEVLGASYDHMTPSDDRAQIRFVSKAMWKLDREANVELQRGYVSALTPLLSGQSSAFILPMNIGGKLYQFSEIELIYLITFYFSEIARYSPHTWLKLHSGQSSFSVLLCQDILRACENKFLQLLQNKMTYAVLVPFGQIANGQIANQQNAPLVEQHSVPANSLGGNDTAAAG